MTRHIFGQTAAHAHNIRFKKGGIDRNTNSGASIKQLWFYKQLCF